MCAGAVGDVRRCCGWIVVDEAALQHALTSAGAKSTPADHQRRELRLSRTLQKIPPHRPNPCKDTQDGPLHARNTANMKLNVKNIRYLSPDDWRVLTAVCARTRLSIA
jgi:hypothetical protein